MFIAQTQSEVRFDDEAQPHRTQVTDKSFQRGEAYYQQGAVVDRSQRGNCLCGEVEGNEVEPYHVTICVPQRFANEFDAGGVTHPISEATLLGGEPA